MDPDSSSCTEIDRFSREYLYGCRGPESSFQDPTPFTTALRKIKYNRILRIVDKMFLFCNASQPIFTGNNTAKLTSFLFTSKLEFVSKGCNSYRKTSPLQYSFFQNFREKAVFLHSEIQCLKNSLRNKSHRDDILNERGKYIMVVVRSKKNLWGKPIYGVSLPCRGCQKALKSFGIQTVIYTLDQDESSRYPLIRLGGLLLTGDGYHNINLSEWWLEKNGAMDHAM